MQVAAALPGFLTGVTDQIDPDRDLAERFRSGDRGAFDTLVRRHQKGVWRIVRRYVKRDADAADITQQVFVRAFKGLATFRGSATLRSWLYRIAINCSLSWIRDHRREWPAEISDDALSEAAVGTTRIASDQESKQLRLAIEELPPKQRLVWLDGEPFDLDEIEPSALDEVAPDPALETSDDIEDDAVTDPAGDDGILPVVDYGWLETLDDAAVARAESWLARKRS